MHRCTNQEDIRRDQEIKYIEKFNFVAVKNNYKLTHYSGYYSVGIGIRVAADMNSSLSGV